MKNFRYSLPLLSLPVLTLALALWGSERLDAADEQRPDSKAEQKQEQAGTGLHLFASPEEAGAALAQSASLKDRVALVAILGDDAEAALGGGDDPATDGELAAFARAFQTRHEWAELNGFQVLLVGEDLWPFPIPLARLPGQQWAFDIQTGLDELALRRLGRNELDVMEVCLAYFEAQMDYYRLNPERAETPRYAARLVSTPGRRDGLYWPATGPEDPPSPLGELLALADRSAADDSATPSEAPRPYYGYYFKALTGPGPLAPGGAWDYVVDGQAIGGFGLLAYPAEYGRSGVMSFMINQSGRLYEKDLGPRTEELASRQTLFNPDAGWTLVPE